MMRVPLKVLILLAAALALAGAALAAPGKAAGSDDKKIEDITRLTAPSVVRVEARNGIRKVATGVVLDKDGFIATTALISPRDEEIHITTADGKSWQRPTLQADSSTVQFKGSTVCGITSVGGHIAIIGTDAPGQLKDYFGRLVAR